ncbi:DUF4878 domain-containing protein [Aminipila sp.]|uniref:DUF4878 domain-containing protein n=1 Tax=Aminipila sp. TaxID=2060095 RepID=UPI0028986316|nr:DUF4878 domain-containing protein [Aminipila sp.]
MKKKLSLLLVLVLCFTLFSCVKQPTPTDVANSYLSAIKSNDTEQLTKLYAGDISTVSFQAACDDMSDSFSKELAKNVTTKFTSFEYKISNEIIKDDKATVDVTIKTYNLGDAFKSAISEYITEGISLAISGTSEEEINKLLEDKLSKKISEATFDYESTVPLSLTKTKDGWIIDEYSDDSEFLNALTGGIIDTSKDMAESFGDSETE